MIPFKEQISREVDAIAEDIVGISYEIHAHPEVAYQEYYACEYLSKFLEKKGFRVDSKVGGLDTAFYAEPLQGCNIRPTVAFLAEYDALPKIGHGCGHNLICAASIGAAVVLSRILADLKGSIVVVGTPGEEGGGGKVLLWEAGIFTKVDVAMMFHPNHRTILGENTLGRIKFRLEFFGKSAHASASPHQGVNALDAIILTFNSINALRQQTFEDARIHGIITHGGIAPNIIPDYSAGLFYVRATTMDYLKELFDKVAHCAHGAARATGCSVEIKIEPPILEPMKRNRSLELICRENVIHLSLAIDDDERQGGSSDIGNLSRKIPAIQPTIAICDRNVPLHSEEFAKASQTPRAHEALLKATKMLAMTAMDYLTSPNSQERVAEEFGSS